MDDLIKPANCFDKHAELKWWLGALAGTQGRNESQEIKYRFERWFTEKHTKHWFTGKNKEDTEKVISKAVEDLESLGR